MQTDRWALITGASHGIGRALAHEAAADGYNVCLVARSEEELHQAAEELEQTCNIHTKVIALDLAQPESAQELVDQLEDLSVHLLINNAGMGLGGAFGTIALEKQQTMMVLNMYTLTSLTHLLLPRLQETQGSILNIASTAAYLPGPGMAVYFASKAYVLSLSEALNQELKDSGVTVTALCPGPTKTEFDRVAGVRGTRMFASTMSAQTVAQAGYKALKQRKAVCVPGVQNKLAVFLLRFIPHSVSGWLTKQALR